MPIEHLTQQARTLEFSNEAFALFLFLQALDVVTTMIGLRTGAHEGSAFVRRLLDFGPVAGLLLSKAISIVLVTAVVAFRRDRLMQRLNRWYAGLVTWNLVIILFQCWR